MTPTIQFLVTSLTPDTCADKFENLERINSIRETNGNFDSLAHVYLNVWFPAIYMSNVIQNFRLFLASN